MSHEMTWDEVAARFAGARTWWVSTAGEGGPHAVPVWGVVVDGVLTFYSQASSVRARNLAADPRVVLHLEDGESPLIVNGTAVVTGVVEDRPDLAALYREKYVAPDDGEYLPDADGMAGTLVHEVTPAKAMAWTVAASDAWTTRRWSA
jgi:nitroimidazol reductase NimA-like FMN-containing flavoprotein (pyridoxamine 5'-phosphate oxidase superfamily)